MYSITPFQEISTYFTLQIICAIYYLEIYYTFYFYSHELTQMLQ